MARNKGKPDARVSVAAASAAAASTHADAAGPVPRRDVHDSLGYLLKHARQRLASLNAAVFGPLGIDGRDLAVLTVLEGAEPASQYEAARRLGVDRTTMVALIDGLEAKGLVVRRPDPADRRRNVVALTAAGRRTFVEASRAADEAEATLLAPLSARDRERFRKMLRAIVLAGDADGSKAGDVLLSGATSGRR